MLLVGEPGQTYNMLLQVLREGKIFTNPDPDSNATSSAPDGDLDAAYALFLAGHKWQNSAYTERGIKVGRIAICYFPFAFSKVGVARSAKAFKPSSTSACCLMSGKVH